MFRIILLSAALSSAISNVASASSDKAWNALFAKVNGTCIGQSGLDTPEASAPVVFDDSVGKVAVLLRGKTGVGRSASKVEMVCLYDKKTGRAAVSEYRWLGR